MEMLSPKQKTAIIIAGVIVVGIFIFYMVTKTKGYDYSVINEAIEDNINEQDGQNEMEEDDEKEQIIIHITGAVKNEGIVKLEEGSRIADAIKAAGGTTDEANMLPINLAYMLKDGQKIYIPKTSDISEELNQSEDNQINIILDDSDEDSEAKRKTNINSESMSELMRIPGIGEVTAAKIIVYRKTNGDFKNIEDIKNVSGIGEAKYENIKDYICVK